MHGYCCTPMPNADAEPSCVERILQRVRAATRDLAQTVVGGVDVLAKADRVHIRVEPAGRGHDHAPGRHIVRFDQPGVAVTALYSEAVEVGGRDCADEALNGEVRRLRCGGYEVPLGRLACGVLDARPAERPESEMRAPERYEDGDADMPRGTGLMTLEDAAEAQRQRHG